MTPPTRPRGEASVSGERASTGAARVTAAPASEHRAGPLVHAPWTAKWYAGDPDLARIFGAAPSERTLRARAAALDARAAGRGAPWRRAAAAAGLPDGALVVLAGQQPVLGGGPLLTAHKTATAVALARHLTSMLDRPVVPIFLVADEDHDSTEVDHVDVIESSKGALRRIRCPVHPKGEALHRSSWDAATLRPSLRKIIGDRTTSGCSLQDVVGAAETRSIGSHVVELLRATFGPLGLVTVSAHALTGEAIPVLEQALRRPGEAARELKAGAQRMAAAGLPPSFDPEDPRPLVMESHASRRRRVAAADGEALERLAAAPDDFSPHAALRPLVQAATLPVIAQVAGPSELLYLGQARGLHEWMDLEPPVLVPRLEATRLEPEDVARLGGELARIDLEDATRAAPLAEEQALLEAARALSRRVLALDPGLGAQAARWLAGVERGAHRLAEAPAWRGRARADTLQHLRPRGRWQDTVLAWLPDACRLGEPRVWAERLVALSRPLEPPAHVLHVLPEEGRDG